MYLQVLHRLKTPILALWIALLVVSSGFVVYKLLLSEKLIIDNSVGVWFDAEDPAILNYRFYNDTFGDEEWSILLLQTESIYNTRFLTELDQITQQVESLDNVIKVTSITNVRDNFTNPDDELDYRPLFSEKVLDNPDHLKEFQSALLKNPIFDRNLILKEDERYTVILIQNDNLVYDQSSYRINLVRSIRELISQFDSIDNHAFVGTTVVNADLNSAAIRDVFVFYTLVTLLLTAIAWFMLRSIRNLLVMYAVVATSALPAMGLLAALGVSYNIMTVMLPTVLIALSIAGVIHILSEFHHLRSVGNQQGQKSTSESAMQTTLRRLYKPTLWTTLTTVVGFSAFTTSNVDPVFQFGAIAAFGLILACIANLVISPLLLLMLWPDDLPSPPQLSKQTVPTWAKAGTLHPKRILKLSAILLVPLFGLFMLKVDTNYVKFFSKNHPTTQAYDLVEQSGFAQNPIIVHLTYPSDAPFSELASFKATQEFETAIAELPQVIKLLSASDFLEEINIAFNGDKASPLTEYNKSQLDQLLFLGELSGNDDLSDLITNEGSDVQLVVLTDYLGNRDLEALRNQILNFQDSFLPNTISMSITGTTTLWANMDEDVTHTQIWSLLFIGVFLAIFLPIIFGSVSVGLLGLVINLLPLSVALGTMALVGIKINMATALVGAMAMGIVVDDTIHFISAIMRNKRAGHSTNSSIERARDTVGQSIIRTTLILVVGFSCMAVSSFLPTAHFGIFIALSIALALILDLFCLPALLRRFPMLIEGHNFTLSQQSQIGK